jgi:hypothetical protein
MSNEYYVKVKFEDCSLTDPKPRKLEETADKCLRAEFVNFENNQERECESKGKVLEPITSITID